MRNDSLGEHSLSCTYRSARQAIQAVPGVLPNRLSIFDHVSAKPGVISDSLTSTKCWRAVRGTTVIGIVGGLHDRHPISSVLMNDSWFDSHPSRDFSQNV
uniref:Uncharacterized protein n=1 Tax=Cacopsylla melanoneura TaxID=428564 RepID=A0A8D8X342_9HEMI